MSIDDRTPDIWEVRSMYCAGSNLFRETPEQHYLGHPAPDYGAEFDRFLARVRRDAAREALDGLADEANHVDWEMDGPSFALRVLRFKNRKYPEKEN